MTTKDFIKTELSLNLAELAEKMWPDNKDAKTYLSRKLNGSRPWTEVDTVKAKEALKLMVTELDKKVRNLD